MQECSFKELNRQRFILSYSSGVPTREILREFKPTYRSTCSGDRGAIKSVLFSSSAIAGIRKEERIIRSRLIKFYDTTMVDKEAMRLGTNEQFNDKTHPVPKIKFFGLG